MAIRKCRLQKIVEGQDPENIYLETTADQVKMANGTGSVESSIASMLPLTGGTMAGPIKTDEGFAPTSNAGRYRNTIVRPINGGISITYGESMTSEGDVPAICLSVYPTDDAQTKSIFLTGSKQVSDAQLARLQIGDPLADSDALNVKTGNARYSSVVSFDDDLYANTGYSVIGTNKCSIYKNNYNDSSAPIITPHITFTLIRNVESNGHSKSRSRLLLNGFIVITVNTVPSASTEFFTLDTSYIKSKFYDILKNYGVSSVDKIEWSRCSSCGFVYNITKKSMLGIAKFINASELSIEYLYTTAGRLAVGDNVCFVF